MTRPNMATYDPPAPLGPARPQDRLPKLGTQFYFDSVNYHKQPSEYKSGRL